MKSKLKTFFALSLGFLAVCGVMFAHHGTNASYDMDKEVTLTGTVTSFLWSNPHCQVYFDVKDDKGNVVQWGAETHSPGQLKNGGWNRETLKPGDLITITVNPSRAGSPVGVISKIVLPNGKAYSRAQMAGGGNAGN